MLIALEVEKDMLLNVKDVTKDFGGLRALENVNMNFEEGKITALIGPNGAGKTTLFNIIVGVYPLTEGSVFFRDKRIDGLPTHKIVKEGIARTFQLPKLFKKLTVLENVMVGRHLRTPESTFFPVALNLPRVRRDEVRTYEEKGKRAGWQFAAWAAAAAGDGPRYGHRAYATASG